MTPRQTLNSNLALAFSRRWRTAPSQASMNLAAGSLEAQSLLPSVGGTRMAVGRGPLSENYKQTLKDAGFSIADPSNDREKEHETWHGDRDFEILIDHEGNEWHQLDDEGVVKQVGKLDDDSLGKFMNESNDAQSPDQYKTTSTFNNDTNEPRFLRYAKAELARRRDLRCPDCGYMGLPAGDGACPNCGGKLSEPKNQQNDQQDVNMTDVREAIIRQVRNKKR